MLQQLRIHSFWNDLLTHPGKQRNKNGKSNSWENYGRDVYKQLEVLQPFTLPNERPKSQTQYIGGCLLIVQSAFGRFGFYQFYSRWHIFPPNIPDNDTVVQCNVDINGAPLQEAHLCHVGCHDTNLRDFKFSLEEGVLETRDPRQTQGFFLPSMIWQRRELRGGHIRSYCNTNLVSAWAAFWIVKGCYCRSSTNHVSSHLLSKMDFPHKTGIKKEHSALSGTCCNIQPRPQEMGGTCPFPYCPPLLTWQATNNITTLHPPPIP